ncbi:MAG: S41 family peptidase [Flavobacteriaceae bacterium]|tara:strand:- start:2414 stop:4006 length:1593 start_codon:yes stop_codon:yes gene_type:complete
MKVINLIKFEISIKGLICLCLFFIISIKCSKKDIDDNEINVVSDVESDSKDSSPEITLSTEINDFIWKGLNQYYYWQSDVSDLADSKATTESEYIALLNSQQDSNEFFDGLLHPDDRFSWIEEDFDVLESQLSGTTSSNGMKFQLYVRDDGERIIGAVRYVLPESDAFKKGIVRGDIFNSVNGSELNFNNYMSLLYGEQTSYSIELVNYDPENDLVTSREISITLNKEENFQEVPIHNISIIEHNSKKIGYVMYNKFLGTVDSDGDGEIDRDFNQELIDLFIYLKSQNLDELVLDLRYNGGGSVNTCTILASLITGQFTGTIFAKQIWNEKIMAFIEERNSNDDPSDDLNFDNYFTDLTPDGNPLPSLGLSRLYVLTSNRTASSSELLINGLTPHIDIIQIGIKTVGKNVGSITLYDYTDNDQQIKNPKHKYAMQPIVLKIANSENFADYNYGLEPDIEYREKASNLGTIGDKSEPLLSLALDHISGSSKKKIEIKELLVPFFEPDIDKNQIMFIDKINFKVLTDTKIRK